MKRLTFPLLFLLAAFFASAQETVMPASKILTAAYKQAAAQKKNVVLIFHASWCG